MAQLVPAVFGTLNATGYFYDPVERGAYEWHYISDHITAAPNLRLAVRVRVQHMSGVSPRAEVERFFVPWLMDATVDRVSQALTTRMALDSIIRQAVQERARVNELSLQRRDEYKRGVH